MIKTLLSASLPFVAIACLAAPTPASIIENIHVDQFGYRCGDQKVAVVSNAQTGYYGSAYTPGTAANQYEVRRWGDDAVEFTGSLTVWGNGATHAQSGDKAWWFDFSALSMPGSYYIYDVATGKASGEFIVDNQVYRQVLKQAMRTYYYQRCGMAKVTPYAGAGWTDAACHVGNLQDKDCRLYNNTAAASSKDLSGGWHDAGDYNKYTAFTLGALTDLLLAYQENPSVWTDDFNIPESGNGMPDILDEAKYELDWLLKMQQADGGVLSIVGVATNSGSASPPSADEGQRVYGPATSNASFVTAAVCALAAIQFNTAGNTTYAATLQAAAIRAYNWANSQPAAVIFYNTGLIGAGEQEVGAGSYELFMRQLMAAIYLYKLTGVTDYKTFVESNYKNFHLILWGFAYPFETAEQDALLNYAAIPGVSAAVKNDITNAYTSSIKTNNTDNLPAFLNGKDAYRAYLSDQNYTWGSNSTKSHQGLMFTNMVHYGLNPSQDTDYLNAASGYLHYLHGVNPTGFCYLTNMAAYGAKKSVPEFYNSWFADGSPLWDRVGTSTYGPAPGYLPGGPTPTYATDGCCVNNSCGSTANNALCNPALVTPPLGQPTQKSYKDFNAGWPQDSWEVSENGIYYQAAYIKLLSAFMDTSTACSAVLAYSPVTLTAIFKPTNTTKATWTVAGTTATVRYMVQKSVDGRVFDSLATVPANINNQYVFYDNNMNTPTAWYRLRMTDKNGDITWSNTVMVKHGTIGGLAIYPNPAKNEITVSFTNNQGAGPGVLQLKDAAGRTVLLRSIQVQPGYNSCTLPLANLAAAVYFVTLTEGSKQTEEAKLVKW